MPDDDRQDQDPERGSPVDKHGFDNVMRGLLAVKPIKPDDDPSWKKKNRKRTQNP